jgi:hypothetical protein
MQKRGGGLNSPPFCLGGRLSFYGKAIRCTEVLEDTIKRQLILVPRVILFYSARGDTLIIGVREGHDNYYVPFPLFPSLSQRLFKNSRNCHISARVRSYDLKANA